MCSSRVLLSPQRGTFLSRAISVYRFYHLCVQTYPEANHPSRVSPANALDETLVSRLRYCGRVSHHLLVRLSSLQGPHSMCEATIEASVVVFVLHKNLPWLSLPKPRCYSDRMTLSDPKPGHWNEMRSPAPTDCFPCETYVLCLWHLSSLSP